MSSRRVELNEQTVNRVLDAAEAVFEERGFAGARVDEIAERAGMSKSQIYYHLRGKQAIFDELVRHRIGEILAEKDAVLGEQDGGLGDDPGEIADRVRTLIERVLVPRAAFLRIVLLESVGETGGEETLLMRVIRPVLDDSLRRFEELGFPVDRDRTASDFFHFAIVPTIVHIALGDRWARALGATPGRADDVYFASLRSLEEAYLRRLDASGRAIGKVDGSVARPAGSPEGRVS